MSEQTAKTWPRRRVDENQRRKASLRALTRIDGRLRITSVVCALILTALVLIVGGRNPQPVSHAQAPVGPPSCETDLTGQWSVREAWTRLGNAQRIVNELGGGSIARSERARSDVYEELRVAESHLTEVTNDYLLRYVKYSPCVSCNPAKLRVAAAELQRLGALIDSSFGNGGILSTIDSWAGHPYCGVYFNSADPRVKKAVAAVTGRYGSGEAARRVSACSLELTTAAGTHGRSIKHNCHQWPLYYWPIGSGITLVDARGKIVIEYSHGGDRTNTTYWEGNALPPAARVTYFLERRSAAAAPTPSRSATPGPTPPPPGGGGYSLYYLIGEFTCCRQSDGVTPHPVRIDQAASVKRDPNARVLGSRVFPTREDAQRFLCSHRICPHGPEGTWTTIDGVVLTRTGCPMNCQ